MNIYQEIKQKLIDCVDAYGHNSVRNIADKSGINHQALYRIIHNGAIMPDNVIKLCNYFKVTPVLLTEAEYKVLQEIRNEINR